MDLLSLVIQRCNWGWTSCFITFSRWRNSSSIVSDAWLILTWSTVVLIWHKIWWYLTNVCFSTGILSSHSLGSKWLNLSFSIWWWFYILNLTWFSFCLVSWHRYFTITTIIKIFWRFISLAKSVRLYAMGLCINMFWLIFNIILMSLNLLSHIDWETWWRRW